MHHRYTLLAAPLALALACGGSTSTTGSGSAALDAATPSYAALAIDQVSTDTTAAALTADSTQSALTVAAPVISGAPCHPHLFIRQREIVERVNRHIYKALRHVEALIAKNPLTSTDTTKTWESVDNGIDRKFTVTLVSPDVYSWELDIGPVGTTPLPVAITGQIDRAGATGPHQGKGTLHIDFAKLHAGFSAEKVAQGTLDVQFDVQAASRKLTVTAVGVAWDLDATKFESAAVVNALSAPRSGSYVYFREPGKGGSLKIQDQMLFACPANTSLLPADAQLVSRWYKSADGAIHGRSDALLQNGQLPAANVDRVVGVTCHDSAAEGRAQTEGFWLMKAENASGGTITGASSTSASDPSATPCDPVFGNVPTLIDGKNDFTGWPSSYSDGIPFPFPNM
jgi:hypothetical protein